MFLTDHIYSIQEDVLPYYEAVTRVGKLVNEDKEFQARALKIAKLTATQIAI